MLSTLPSAARASEVLSYWFGPKWSDNEVTPNFALWFEGAPETDSDIKSRFSADVEAAAAGKYDDLLQDKFGCVALCVILDQFPLNIFRDAARGYEISANHALPVTRHAIAQGFDYQVHPAMRMFLYLPLEHSEKLADQDECVALFKKSHDTIKAAGRPEEEVNGAAELIRFAELHRDVVKAHGRFPGRNKAHGRESTPAELEYLANGGVF